MNPCSTCHVNDRRKGKSDCLECCAAQKRAYRKRFAGLSPEERAKERIRWRTHSLIRSGKLKREPCFYCKGEKVEAHHPDYTRADLVEWLCKPHHQVRHLILRSEAA